ncbi:signal-transducing adaptor protein 2 isoform X7 [Rattus norvegicus]|uniref:signal-transducing adaptor protein 2 isoform X7 n=1 Tax=Rattus norvegicus TaxID=10116 RepID=UPI002FD8474E
MVMASALCPPRGPKLKGAPPSHYYENFLEKKGPCDQDYRKFWAGLQGLAICFYNSNRDLQPLEKLDLRLFSKLKDEALLGSSHDTTYHFSLVLRDQEVKFKVESLESCEMWKGFILTVVELRVPSNLTLLPGHMYMMAEVLAKEEVRRAAEVPWCFLQVSRLEAQLLLERYPECGNLLLRPGGDGKDSVSVTTRQILNGSPVIKHYKVKREGSKYVIDVEDPFSCPSLEAVVNYFVTHTKRALVPFLLDEDYEKVLGCPPSLFQASWIRIGRMARMHGLCPPPEAQALPSLLMSQSHSHLYLCLCPARKTSCLNYLPCLSYQTRMRTM